MSTIEEHEVQLRAAVINHARAIYAGVIQDFLQRVTPAPLVKAPSVLAPDMATRSAALDARPSIRNAVLFILARMSRPLAETCQDAVKLLDDHRVNIDIKSVYKEIRRMRTAKLLTDGPHGLMLVSAS